MASLAPPLASRVLLWSAVAVALGVGTRAAWRLHAFVNEAASRHGAVVVNLFRERADDPFVMQASLNASDGLHPGDAG